MGKAFVKVSYQGHRQGGLAKARTYPFDLREAFKEKLLSLPLSVNSQKNRTSSIARLDSNDSLFRRDQRAEVRRSINRSPSCINLSTNGECHIIKLKISQVV